jgi:predicted nucleotidyltransferase
MKLELKIIDLLAKNVERKFTINEIAKNLGEFYSFVHRIVNRLTKDGVIIKNKVGKSYICSLNLENEKTLTLLQLAEIEKVKQFYVVNKGLKLILEDFVELIKSELKNRAVVVLFGSYAKGTATKESDIDILLISGGKIDVEKITREIYAKYGKEITPIVMTPNDFKKQMGKALIKEIIKDHYILYGVENFINLVFRR